MRERVGCVDEDEVDLLAVENIIAIDIVGVRRRYHTIHLQPPPSMSTSNLQINR